MYVPTPEHEGEPIILDGSNIAHLGGFEHLLNLEVELSSQGWEVVVVVDASLRHKVDEDALEERIDDGWIQVPKGTDADVYILDEAKRLDAWVVSGDAFSEYEPPRRRLDPALMLPLLA